MGRLDCAEVVGAAHQVHPRHQRPLGVGARATVMRQRVQGPAARRVASLDGGRVDPRARAGGQEHCGYRRGRPADHPAGDADDATPGVVLDHLSQQQPGDRHQPWLAPSARLLQIAEDAGEGPHLAGQPIDADQDGQASGRGVDHPHQQSSCSPVGYPEAFRCEG